ncbi:reverse transcriptase-like protein [Uliginosibacterium sp. H1]|uniref:reverse transcriptase-like protein n=1 Tax=Uliginosibacterium sp. H1 TaxID=3114757 RepID=UPI002E16F1FE|nr:reverse transcriptase-like protein [Uliginosibacterium sp. H1]
MTSRATTPLPPDCWLIHCDGTALPNPGRIGIGVLLRAPDGSEHRLSRTQGSGCNNEAETRALLLALAEAQRLGAQHLRVLSDSDVLVQHVAGSASTAVPRLAALFAEVRDTLAQFTQAELLWVPRHRNSDADTLARAALGLPAKPAKHPSHR